MSTEVTRDAYRSRKFSEGFPSLHELSPKGKNMRARDLNVERTRVGKTIRYLGRLVDLDGSQNVLVLGCGPFPRTAEILAEAGNKIVAVDPVESFVQSADKYLAGRAMVLKGAAESIPLPDSSQDIVLFEAVLEHVDSVGSSLREIHRVLAPGGVLYLTTTNRYRFSLTGKNGEYNAPFYNWYPKLVKESFVFAHLHYTPNLANYSERPAVHWFTFDELCSLGRDAGYAQFYSPLDLMHVDDEIIRPSVFRRFVLRNVQRSPWFRAVALTQMGGSIFMLKRRG